VKEEQEEMRMEKKRKKIVRHTQIYLKMKHHKIIRKKLKEVFMILYFSRIHSS
jgi:hypothetical protein